MLYETIDETITCPTCSGSGTIIRKVQKDFTAEEEAAAKDAISKLPPKEPVADGKA